MTIFLGRNDIQLCPVAAPLAYLAVSGSGEGPLFYLEDGRVLKQTQLVVEVRRSLARGVLRSQDYSWHSFRIGAVVTAVACGLEEPSVPAVHQAPKRDLNNIVRVHHPDGCQCLLCHCCQRYNGKHCCCAIVVYANAQMVLSMLIHRCCWQC